MIKYYIYIHREYCSCKLMFNFIYYELVFWKMNYIQNMCKEVNTVTIIVILNEVFCKGSTAVELKHKWKVCCESQSEPIPTRLSFLKFSSLNTVTDKVSCMPHQEHHRLRSLLFTLWDQTYRSIWESLQSARWSGRAWCPAQPAECAASHRGRSRRPCQPATGTQATAPPEDWWSRTPAGRCCCTHLNITERTGEGAEWIYAVWWRTWSLKYVAVLLWLAVANEASSSWVDFHGCQLEDAFVHNEWTSSFEVSKVPYTFSKILVLLVYM